MRTHLLDPTEKHPQRDEAVALSGRVYELYEAGQDFNSPLKKLGQIAGRPIHEFALQSAFASVSHETFAKSQLVDWDDLPDEIAEQEMLEMIELISAGKGDEFQHQYWIACLRANTGDDKISDLLFWPGSYFGDGNDARIMSPSEILTTAIKSGNTHRIR